MTKVAVIGAGIAGMTAALRLAQRGFEVRVFEERGEVGGKLGAHRGRIDAELVEKLKPEERKPFLDPAPKFSKNNVPKWAATKISKYLKGREAEGARRDDRDPRPIAARLFPGSQAKGTTKGAAARSPTRSPQTKVAPVASLGQTTSSEWLIHATATGSRGGKPGAGKPAGDDALEARFRIALHRGADQRLRVAITDNVYHEHCYHMYLNWYHNFWELMRDIGCEKTKKFKAHHRLTHLFPGSGPIRERSHTLGGLSALGAAADNLLSGAESLPDMFLWFYSCADLVSHPLNPARYLDRTSVHTFMRSRWYATSSSAQFHENLLAKAFAVPTYYSSAYAYRRYLEYSVADPDPMLWVLKGEGYKEMLEPLARALCDEHCDLRPGCSVTKLELEEDRARDARITKIKFKPSSMRVGDQITGDGEREVSETSPEVTSDFVPDYVISAVPPPALASIMSGLRDRVPGLSTVRKLQSGITAALDVYFTRKLKGLPDNHVVLRGSRFGLTFIDNSQNWPKDEENGKWLGEDVTFLNVAATDFYMIDGMTKEEALWAILDDLRRFLDFDFEDVDLSKTYLQMNDWDPLFVNEAGSEPWRPKTVTEIPNFFVAGDFCDNEIGIVSVEGAVVSGLRAARAVQAQLRADQLDISLDDKRLMEIPIRLPETYPLVNADALKLLLTPQAALGKAWSVAAEMIAHPERVLSPVQMAARLEEALMAPGAVTADWGKYAIDAFRWLADAPYSDD